MPVPVETFLEKCRYLRCYIACDCLPHAKLDHKPDLAWGHLAPGALSLSSSRRQPSDYPSNRDYDDASLLSPTVSFARKNNLHANWKYERGECDDEEEEGGIMHLVYCAPVNKGLTMRDTYHTTQSKSQSSNGRSKKAVNALDEIHNEWKEMQSLTYSIQHGSLQGATGKPLVDIVIVSASGMTVPHALEFVHHALMDSEEAEMASFVDPSSLIYTTTTTAACNNAAATVAAGYCDSGSTACRNNNHHHHC